MPQRNAPSAQRATRPAKPALARVQSKTLRELAFEELKRALIAGRFAPGEPVTIAQIANQLKIGAMPAREAVQQLASQGAFEFLANRSVRVPRVDAAGLDDLFEARLLIETNLVRRAAVRQAAFAGGQLARALSSLERATSARNMAESLAANYAFHFLIYRASAAPLLVDIAGRLWLRMSPIHVAVFRANAGQQSAFLATLPSHRLLVDALTAGDEPAAVRTFRQMLTHSREWHRDNIAKGG